MAKSNEINNERSSEKKLLAILHHQRHNWLNDLQLIFGYIKLKKYDRLENYMEKLKRRLEIEGRIASIPYPRLALDLLLFDYSNSLFKLNVELEQRILQRCEQNLLTAVHQELMSRLEIMQRISYATHDMVNELTVRIREEHGDLVLILDYVGHYDEAKFTQYVANDPSLYGGHARWMTDQGRLNAVVTIYANEV